MTVLLGIVILIFLLKKIFVDLIGKILSRDHDYEESKLTNPEPDNREGKKNSEKD